MIRVSRPLLLATLVLSLGVAAPGWAATGSRESTLSSASKLYGQGKYEKTAVLLRTELARRPRTPGRVETRFLLAAAQENLGALEDALANYEKVSRGKTLGDYALYHAASLLARLDDPEGALWQLRALLSRFPHSVLIGKSYALAATALEEVGDLPAALQTWKRLLRCCSENALIPQALFHQATILEKLGRYAQAVALYRQVRIRFPSREEASQAEKRLRSLIPPGEKPAPLSDQDLWLRAQAWFDSGRPQAARADLSKLMREYPHSSLVPGTLFRLGISDLDSTTPDEGPRTLEGFLRRYPGSRLAPEALYRLGRYFWWENRQQAARKYLAQLLSRFPGNTRIPEAYLIIGRTYEEEGKREKARETYEKLLKTPSPRDIRLKALWRLGWNAFLSARYPEAYAAWQRGAARASRGSEGDRFAYWQARTAEKMGAHGEALLLLRKLQRKSPASYYGQLARGWLEREGKSWERWPRPGRRRELLPPAPRRWRENLQVRNAQAFLRIGFQSQAQGELDALARELPDSLQSHYWMADLYAQGGFFPQSFYNLNRFLHDLPRKKREELPADFWKRLYPVKYRNLVDQQARLHGLPAPLLFAVMRQESAFNPQALSRAGARGLLQLLPSTARKLSSGTRNLHAQDLFDPRINIRLGSKYLSDLLRTYDDQLPLALASYNAGENALNRWLSQGKLQMDEFIESIPYAETRDYVKQVLRNLFNYQTLYTFHRQAKLWANFP